MTTVLDARKTLIVGGAGFVGSNLVRMLLNISGSMITVVDNLLSSEKQNLPEDQRVAFMSGSITDEGILSEIDDTYDYIFHLATFHGNQNSIYDPLADHENNTLTTLKLLNHVKNFKNIKKIVYSGAGCSCAEKTFGDASPTSEGAPISIAQDSPYSISKMIGEFYCVYFYRQLGLPTVRARFQNVYGPGEVLGAGKWRGTSATIWRNVIPTFIYKALKEEPLPVEGDGRTARDFIYVEDICRGLLACAGGGKPGDVYNLASGVETDILDLASMVNELTENPAGIEFRPRRSWDNSGRRYGSTEKSKGELGFVAETLLRDGLKKTVDWTRNNLPFIEECIARQEAHMSAETGLPQSETVS